MAEKRDAGVCKVTLLSPRHFPGATAPECHPDDGRKGLVSPLAGSPEAVPRAARCPGLRPGVTSPQRPLTLTPVPGPGTAGTAVTKHHKQGAEMMQMSPPTRREAGGQSQGGALWARAEKPAQPPSWLRWPGPPSAPLTWGHIPQPLPHHTSSLSAPVSSLIRTPGLTWGGHRSLRPRRWYFETLT